MKPLEIADGIYSVGVTDWNIRDFHGYSTHAGTSYNAFLIVDEKITLIDTVKQAFADELLNNITRIVDPKKIDYVITMIKKIEEEIDGLTARQTDDFRQCRFVIRLYEKFENLFFKLSVAH